MRADEQEPDTRLTVAGERAKPNRRMRTRMYGGVGGEDE
jgi:hypothetical protein